MHEQKEDALLKLLPAAKNVLQSAISEIPGGGATVTLCKEAYDAYQNRKLSIFLKPLDCDLDYLLGKNKEKNQTIFMEYINTIKNTSTEIAIITLALIFKNKDLNNTIKSICANKLSGISVEAIDLFIKEMKYIKNKEKSGGPYLPLTIELAEKEHQLLLEKTGGTGLFFNESSKAKIKKADFQTQVLVQDLTTRGFITVVDVNFSHQQVTTNELTEILYKHLTQAEEYLKKFEAA